MSNDKTDSSGPAGKADTWHNSLRAKLADLGDDTFVSGISRIYLAGPLGFSEIGHLAKSDLIRQLVVLGYEIIDPFALAPVDEIAKIRQLPSLDAQRAAWQKLNLRIGETNRKAIDGCDALLAILDGTDIDSGTAAEIGYAYARGKPIVGYRGDFRLAADNIGATVNLQVEYFIVASGGSIVTKIGDILDSLSRLSPASAIDALELLYTPDETLGGKSPIEILRARPIAARVINKAIVTFGDPKRAVGWLGRPARLLDGLRPLELLDTEEGALRVEETLARIEYGVPP